MIRTAFGDVGDCSEESQAVYTCLTLNLAEINSPWTGNINLTEKKAI